jgi:hypothetical protein
MKVDAGADFALAADPCDKAIAGPKSRSSGSIGSRGCQGLLDVGSGSGQALRSGRVLRSLRRCVCTASEEVRGAIVLPSLI